MVFSDLHIHSNYSNDGEFEIPDIVNRCHAQKIDFFSLTDHNSVKGIGEAMNQAQQATIDFISGIEIDCNYKGIDLHVLGYHINWKSNDFSVLEEDFSSKIINSFDEMICNLKKMGFVIDTDAVLRKANGKLPSPELIAEVMLSDEKYYSPLLTPYMKGGERSDMPYINFYLDYFEQGKPAFVPIDFMSFNDVIHMIKDNGGVPIVAHPGRNLNGREEIAEQLLEQGAEGLEVFNNYHNTEQIRYFASLVEKSSAIMTCGSDFHGKTKPLINIGQFSFDRQYEDYLKNSMKFLRNL